ncbi:MAG: hypothetical protein CSA36_08870, partial [Draconibacterium sp.]
ISGKITNSPACKDSRKSADKIDNVTCIPDTLSCVEYSFDEEQSKLTLKHINSGFNCCPDSLLCKVKLAGDTILIKEFEKSTLCRCICLYDLDIEILGVTPKKYKIMFVEPYVWEMDEIIFEVDLTKNVVGKYCVVRKEYPWGISI